MKKILSFIEWEKHLLEYENINEFKNSIYDLGLDGLELVRCGDEPFIPNELVYGLHLPFFTSWADYYLGNEKRVIEEFGSIETAKEFYTVEKENFHEYYLKDLEFAKENCEYTVFHIGNTSSLEYLSQNHYYKDEDIIDASIDLINSILNNSSYNKLFLMENLYFPGLRFTDRNLTEKLLENIKYKNKGFMLDIGHLMNTNPDLKTEDEGWDYVEKITEDHRDLLEYFKGIHLHVSVSGEIAKKYKLNPPKLSENFFERFNEIYNYVKDIDTHSIALSKKAIKVIEKIEPEYLVFEFKSETREEREMKIKKQFEVLGM